MILTISYRNQSPDNDHYRNSSDQEKAYPAQSTGTVSFRFVSGFPRLQDLNGGTGPDIDLWECHPASEGDYTHQQFVHDPSTRSLHTKPDVLGGACLTLDRSQPPPPGMEDPWEGR